MEIRNLDTQELEAVELSLKMLSKFIGEVRPVSFDGITESL